MLYVISCITTYLKIKKKLIYISINTRKEITLYTQYNHVHVNMRTFYKYNVKDNTADIY